MPKIILASSSKPRQMLLQRLQIPFTVCPADIDETPLANEPTEKMVLRLAQEKAERIAPQFPDALIIGADQVGTCEHKMLGKPLTNENAIQQLQFVSGRCVRFLIGLCLLNTATNHRQTKLETYDVYFKKLTLQQIENYIAKDNPLNCAGSFKAESLGSLLVEKFSGDDFSALIGLPLIRLTEFLGNEEVNII